MAKAYRISDASGMSTTNALASLVNLFYLIRISSLSPDQVIRYADHADELLRELSAAIESLPTI